MKIAIDFDGTIVEHKYPEIGEEKLFAIETLKQIQKQGHQLVLWTYRTGRELDAAVEFCRKKGLEFYAVNKNYPEEIWEADSPRKIDAEIFIDDRNLGGFVEWSKVWQMFSNESIESLEEEYLRKSKKNIFKRLFG